MGSGKITKIIEISCNYSKFAAHLTYIMDVIFNKKSLVSLLNPIKSRQGSIGFVPTMGALHPGHLSLVSRAARENEVVVVSIFVNPTQFSNQADIEKYPSSLEADKDLLSTLRVAVILFAPSALEMYPEGLFSKIYDFKGIDQFWEGADRPGHFNGVGTVVEKLFECVQPNRAYFGEKDFQQLVIIKQLVAKKKQPIRVLGCPIIREANGLAMSSRNERLSEKGRAQAGIIFKTLQWTASQKGTTSLHVLRKKAIAKLEQTPGLHVFYFEFVSGKTLQPLISSQNSEEGRIVTAVLLEGVRLLDNIEIETTKNI